MLYDAKGFNKIYLKPGYTDLRMSINGLKMTIARDLELNPYEKDVLFLFCGRKSDRIKGLIWEGTGFLLLYKVVEDGRFIWPRNKEEALSLTQEQFKLLMTGFSIESSIREIHPIRAC